MGPGIGKALRKRPAVKGILRPEWLWAFVVGLIGKGAASLVGMPVAWLVGPLIAGLFTSVVLRKRYRIPDLPLVGAQVAIGLTVGLSFSPSTIAQLGVHLPAVAAVLVATTGVSLLNGYLLSRWTEIDRSSGLLGSIPGAASAMVAAADKVGADARTVAVLQYVRLLFILIVVPPALSLWQARIAASNAASAVRSALGAVLEQGIGPDPVSIPEPILWVGIALIGIAGAMIGARLRFPSPFVLGPMVLATLVGLAMPESVRLDAEVPRPVFNASLMMIGASVGLRFNAEILRVLRRAIGIQFALLFALLGVSALFAYALHAISGIDLPTAVMGNIPGALEGMVAVSLDLGANAAIVAAMQTMRSVTLLCIGPWIVRAMHRGQLSAD